VLWSEYGGGKGFKFVRVGTLDSVRDGEGKVVPMGGVRPAAHIYVKSKCSWVGTQGERVYEEMGRKEEYWSRESLERYKEFWERAE
jgi:hypothetical protein